MEVEIVKSTKKRLMSGSQNNFFWEESSTECDLKFGDGDPKEANDVV